MPEASAGAGISQLKVLQEVLPEELGFTSQALPLLAELFVMGPRAVGWGPVVFNYMSDQSVFHVVLK